MSNAAMAQKQGKDVLGALKMAYPELQELIDLTEFRQVLKVSELRFGQCRIGHGAYEVKVVGLFGEVPEELIKYLEEEIERADFFEEDGECPEELADAQAEVARLLFVMGEWGVLQSHPLWAEFAEKVLRSKPDALSQRDRAGRLVW